MIKRTKNSIIVMVLLVSFNSILADSVYLPELNISTNAITPERATKLVTTISANDIKNSKATTLVEALNNFVPGAVSSYGKYFNSGIYLKGASPHSTLILINGVKLLDTSRGSFDLSYIPLSAVEKIEIISNSEGVVYGSQAVIGAINIITRVAEYKNEVEAQAEYGSLHSSRQEASYLSNMGNSNFSVFASTALSSGYSISAADSVGEKENDAYAKQNLVLRYLLADFAGGNVEFFANYSKTYTQYDPFASVRSFPYFYLKDTNNTESSRNDYFTYLKYGVNFLNLAHNFSVSYNHVNRKDYENFEEMGYLNPKDNQYQSTVVNFTYNLEKNFNNLFIKSGIDQDFLNFKETIGIREFTFRAGTKKFGLQATSHNQSASSVYSMANYTVLNKLIINSGVRYNTTSEYTDKNPLNYTVGIALVQDNYKLRSNYFVAYKTPNLFELYDYEYGAAIDKAPDLFVFKQNNQYLRQERNRGADLGIDASFLQNRLNISVSYFVTNIKDLIILKYDISSSRIYGEPLRVYYNRPDAVQLQGVNFNNSYKINNNVTLGVNYNYLHFNQPLPKRPNHSATFYANTNIALKYFFNLNVIAVSKKLDGFDTPAVAGYPSHTVADWQSSGYVLIAANVDYIVNKKLTAYAKIANLLNKEYQNSYGFKGEPRGIYAGIKLKI